MLDKLKKDSLEQMLGFLHFEHVKTLLKFIRWGTHNNYKQELCLKVLDILVKNKHSQLFTHSETKHLLQMIVDNVSATLLDQRKLCLNNKAALSIYQKELTYLSSNN